MSSASWRQFFTYNKYVSVAARATRSALKEEERVRAERRGEMALRFQRWQNGQAGEQTWIEPPKDSTKAKA